MLRRRSEPGPAFDAAVVEAAIEALALVPEGCDGKCAAGEAYKRAVETLPALYRYGPFIGAPRAQVDSGLQYLLGLARR